MHFFSLIANLHGCPACIRLHTPAYDRLLALLRSPCSSHPSSPASPSTSRP
jgi:hypothetical protein